MGLVFRKGQATAEPLDDPNEPSDLFSSSSPASTDRKCLLKYLDILNKDCSGTTVAILAEKVVNAHGSVGVKRINEALDRWRLIWEQRKFRESAVEGSLFSLDPLPFWFLAKLYLLACLIKPPPDSEFRFLLTHTLVSVAEKISAQEKIVGWLNSFRATQESTTTLAGIRSMASCGTSESEEGTRLRNLMRPLQCQQSP